MGAPLFFQRPSRSSLVRRVRGGRKFQLKLSTHVHGAGRKS